MEVNFKDSGEWSNITDIENVKILGYIIDPDTKEKVLVNRLQFANEIRRSKKDKKVKIPKEK